MSRKFTQKELEIYTHVDDVLFYEWDPIGISLDSSCPRNEYRAYLPTLYSKLLQKMNPEIISEYLLEIENDRMGLALTTESKQKAMRIANDLIAYYEKKIVSPDSEVQYGFPFQEYERIVATGTWFYDKTVPMNIKIYSTPAMYSSTRYNEDGELEESRPIPVSPNGLIYKLVPGGGEEDTLEKAKAWADSQPWGPCKWDKVITISKSGLRPDDI
ncbi:MAG: hypothetical protein V4598_06520 [Bdellovibrionota bacterium]